MQTFASKLGFAFYYGLTRSIIPPSGGVVARWFSNVDRLEGSFPQTIFDVLLPPQTLKQGKFEVSSLRISGVLTKASEWHCFVRSSATRLPLSLLRLQTNLSLRLRLLIST